MWSSVPGPSHGCGPEDHRGDPLAGSRPEPPPPHVRRRGGVDARDRLPGRRHRRVCPHAGAEFFLLEVYARLQVEHPITEVTTHVDLVEERLRVASGQGLSFEVTPPRN